MQRVPMSRFKWNVVLICALCIPGVVTKYTPYLNPGFFFDYNKPSQLVPIPVTQQCERIHITWGRRTARGAKPVAPFYVQVFTSTAIVPFLIPVGNGPAFDWDVPFAPGTQYQLCMYDRHGVSGGCQATYTVIPSSTKNTACQNVTTSTNLSILATLPSGPMSQYGFIDQCTDMTITPKSGKPPFILTIAPSLHPPFNITSNSTGPITWTVSLSWASSFYVALSSSDGQMWSNGPMHAGGFGPTDCLAPGSMPRKTVTKVALGAGIGSAVGGIVLGLLCAYLNVRYRRRKAPAPSTLEKETSPDDEDAEVAHPLPPLPSFPSRHSRFGQGLTLFSGSRPEDITVEPFTADPSPGYVAEGLKGRLEGRWRGLAFSTMNSARSGPPSRLRIGTRPLPPVVYERTSSVPSYSRAPETEIFVELPPKYMENPAGSADAL